MRTPFFETVSHLRASEEVVLYGRLLQPAPAEEADVIHFLEAEYDNEALDLPHAPPQYDAPAALWGATIFYRGAQLLLHREHDGTDLESLFPSHAAAPTPSAILSADLCLRFVPMLLSALHRIAADDPLIPILERHLQTWHYSGIGYASYADEQVTPLDFFPVTADPCMFQSYTDRVIRRRDAGRAALPELAPHVKAALGAVSGVLWSDAPL